ncbi:MAG TPA: hypothetical protein VJM09_01290 [Sphingobium sp.]|nr:hypothetical protein [Sphingobium sp.]
MLPDFAATVHALAETVALRESGAPRRPEAASRFVLDSFAGMPAYLRPPMRAATLFFDAWPMIRRRRPFHQLPPEARLRQMEGWEGSPIGPARMLMTFYVSLSLFALWPGEADHD